MAASKEDIARIKQQEAALVLPAFSKEIAWQIGSIARELALSRGAVIGLEIRVAGSPVFLTLLDGTPPNVTHWLRRKANTVALFDSSSYRLFLQLASKQQTLARHALPEAEYAHDGGGFPLRVAHAGLIGSIAVSGLDQRADHEFAVETLCLYLKKDYKALALAS